MSLPETGSQRSEIEKNMISSSAKKKLGSAWPTTATARQSRSIQLLRQIAASTPSGIEIASANDQREQPSSRVVFSLLRISGPAGVLK